MDNKQDVLTLLRGVAEGSVTPEQAALELKRSPFENLGYARVDTHRTVRQGASEVIYGAGKTAQQIAGIAASMMSNGCHNILVTRLDQDKAAQVAQEVPMDYFPVPHIGVVNPKPHPQVGSIVVATGGTSDMPVAEEAALTAEVLGNRVTRLYDVGVAGLHRLLASLDELMQARSGAAAQQPKPAGKQAGRLVELALKGVAAAMGIAVAVLTMLDALDSQAAFLMLGLGLACLAIAQLPEGE